MTVRDLAKKAGISEVTIRKVLDPNDPTHSRFETIEKLALALDCRPAWLRTGEGTPGRKISEPPEGVNVAWVRIPEKPLSIELGLAPNWSYSLDHRATLERAFAAYRAGEIWSGLLETVADSLFDELKDGYEKRSEYVDWVGAPDDETVTNYEAGFLEKTLCVLVGITCSASFGTRRRMEEVIDWCYKGAHLLVPRDAVCPPPEMGEPPSGKVISLAAARRERLQDGSEVGHGRDDRGHRR